VDVNLSAYLASPRCLCAASSAATNSIGVMMWNWCERRDLNFVAFSRYGFLDGQVAALLRDRAGGSQGRCLAIA
jgi:hypothetical protein